MPNDLTIRTGTPKDFELCLALLGDFYLEAGLTTTVEDMKLPLEMLLTASHGIVFLVVCREVPIGMAANAVSVGIEQGGMIAELTDLYVRPEFRNQGAAAMLIAASAEWAAGEGCKRIQLVVTSEAQQGHDLIGYYKAQEFEGTGRTILTRYLE